MDYPNYPNYQERHTNGFATAALVLGICGIATGCCLYTGIICGSLAIIFALLSRGGEMKLSSTAKIGLVLGIVSVASTILLYVVAFASMLTEYGGMEGFLEYYNEILQQMEEGAGYGYEL